MNSAEHIAKHIKKSRMIDLTLLSILAIIAEITSELAIKKFAGAGFHISFSVLISLIAIVRWNGYGALVYIIAGLPMMFLDSNLKVLDAILLYPFANGFIIIASLLFIKMKKSNLQTTFFFLFLYVTLGYLSISLGKGIAAFLIEGKFLGGFMIHFVQHFFSIVMTVIVLVVVRRNKDLLIDMKEYILSLQVEGELKNGTK